MSIDLEQDSRYCVDGILCQTRRNCFDLLLTDYQDFGAPPDEGRREVTEADEESSCGEAVPALPGLAEGALK